MSSHDKPGRDVAQWLFSVQGVGSPKCLVRLLVRSTVFQAVQAGSKPARGTQGSEQSNDDTLYGTPHGCLGLLAPTYFPSSVQSGVDVSLSTRRPPVQIRHEGLMIDEFPLVDIQWLDSIGTNVWADLDELENHGLECRTVGFLVSEDKKTITVASSLNMCGQCGSPIRIPKFAIKSREEITFV